MHTDLTGTLLLFFARMLKKTSDDGFVHGLVWLTVQRFIQVLEPRVPTASSLHRLLTVLTQIVKLLLRLHEVELIS